MHGYLRYYNNITKYTNTQYYKFYTHNRVCCLSDSGSSATDVVTDVTAVFRIPYVPFPVFKISKPVNSKHE